MALRLFTEKNMGFILTRILWGLERRPSASQHPDTALILQAWNAITLLSLVGSTHVLQQKNRSILMSEKIIFCPYTLTLTSVTERENKRMWWGQQRLRSTFKNASWCATSLSTPVVWVFNLGQFAKGTYFWKWVLCRLLRVRSSCNPKP